MEIRDFAQRVLLAETLAEKLMPPPAGSLTDAEPGRAIRLPEVPGRPAGLHFSQKGERGRLPRLEELHEPEARAVLLHAFANHELLAVELMALALLKFPEAPPAFRRGLVLTLQEEQEHTRLYMARMAEGGLALGDLPVNGFFWRSISGMATPLDYVSHLSLTFEQANLDYAKHYGQLFHQIGDAATGGLLDRIYQDEIMHVGYGLTWFRRWKDPARGDWEAWQDTLTFPLSAARAKGNVPFNRDGRLKAGFSEDFIDALDVFSHSRGRTPWVGFFNPAAEACALTRDPATGRHDASTAALTADLDALPAFSLHAEDVVLVQRAPRAAWLKRMRGAGVELPQFEVLKAPGVLAADSSLADRKLGRLRPWGWSADSAALLGPLVANAGEAAFANVPWDEEIRALYSKVTSAAAARELAAGQGIPDETWGVPAGTMEAVAGALEDLLEKGWERACLKAPFGIAGRGLIQVRTSGLTERDLSWLRPVLFQQQAVVVEPWLERIADFSSQYELTPGTLPRLKGQVHLINDAGGRFLACGSSPAFTRLLPAEAARCLHEAGAGDLYNTILPGLLSRLPGLVRLHGGLGIDAFVYRSRDGTPRLRPLVEINPRTTMGRVTLDLRRLVDPSKAFRFSIRHRRSILSGGHDSLADYAGKLEQEDPLVMAETSSGRRITSGSLVLNDAAVAEAFLAVLSVGAT
jgi:uncharacterized ferritin-like protein (DUF455 family)